MQDTLEPQFHYDYDDFDKDYIYTVYSKDNNGIKLLNKAFVSKQKAYEYALNKIKTLLNIINDEFKETNNGTLPLAAQVIYVLFKQKEYSTFEQYNYFKENYKAFFRHTLKEPIMFFVSELHLIN